MGITSILGSALKDLPWRTIANAAMEHAPELYQKARERFQKPGEKAGEVELQARIARLETLLLEQERVIRQQAEKNAKLEEKSAALEALLVRFKIVSGVLFVATMILLALLMK
jgi:uncharacterized coiled-coil protein SlyX